MLACSLRPARSHQGPWSARPACCTRALLPVPPHRRFPRVRQQSQDIPRQRCCFGPSSPRHANSPASQGTFCRALRLVTCAAAEEPPASLLAGVLAPELSTPEALEELMAEAGPGGRLLLCRVRARRHSWPNGHEQPSQVAAVLELVGPLDGKPAPKWERGLGVAQEAQGKEWDQSLVPVIWSAERGVIRALPGAAGKPNADETFERYTVQLTNSELLRFSWGIHCEPDEAYLMEEDPVRRDEILSRIGMQGWNGGLLDEVFKELPVPMKVWNKVVVVDEGVPVQLRVSVDRECSYERVLHLRAPLTLRQLLEVLHKFYTHPVVGQEMEAFCRFASDIAQHYDMDELYWYEVRSPGVYFDSIWHNGPGQHSIAID